MATQIDHIHGRAILPSLNGSIMKHQPLALEIVIANHCQQCRESVRVADALKHEFPALDVRVIDLDAPDAVKPEVVFAVPSYLLNGKIVSLGNPEVQEISGTIRALLQARKTSQ